MPRRTPGADFIPDWQEIWAPSKAESELKDFKFIGVGWYIIRRPGKMDTILVLDAGEGLYKFCVYNDRDPSQDFNTIVNAPVRMDARIHIGENGR